jgi:hypothetical protein
MPCTKVELIAAINLTFSEPPAEAEDNGCQE